MNVSDIQKFMNISEKLPLLIMRDLKWTFHLIKLIPPAIYSFSGDVTGLNAKSFSNSEIKFAQKNLYILSGLYGILKPLDLIQPYSLKWVVN